MELNTLYRRVADHYQSAIETGSLVVGERLPSVRSLMRLHDVSLSTALQACRYLEAQGLVQARARAGYFVQESTESALAAIAEPTIDRLPDPAQYVGVHAKVSEILALGRRSAVKINFGGASGAPELYPAEALRTATVRALKKNPEQLTTMVTHNGHPAFRQVLARRALTRGMTLHADDILITHGCIEALNLALRAVAQAGDTIAVESPTYFGVLQVLESLGLRALEIPTSPQTGISLEALELALHNYPDVKAVIVVPHLQNPLGANMPDAHKERLVALCEQQHIALIEDDTYGELTDGPRPSRALQSWDKSGNVIHCSSLHKTLAPGMRLGWMVAGRWQARVDMFKYAQTRYTAEWSQIAVAEYMGSKAYDRHLQVLKQRLHSQRLRTAQAIARFFPSGTRLNLAGAAVALWLELPAGIDARKVFELALAEGILIAPGTLFSNTDRYDHCLRINCGLPYSPAVDTAIRRLGQIVGNFLEHAESVAA